MHITAYMVECINITNQHTLNYCIPADSRQEAERKVKKYLKKDVDNPQQWVVNKQMPP